MEHIIGQGNNRAAMNMPALNTLPVLKCSKCDSLCFENVFLLRLLSALQSPDGQEHLIPEPTFRCVKCGAIIGERLEDAEQDDSGDSTEPTEPTEPIKESNEDNNEQPEESGKLKLV